MYVGKGNILHDTAYLSEWKLGVVWKRCGDFATERKLDYLWKPFKQETIIVSCFKLFIFKLSVIFENSNAFQKERYIPKTEFGYA